MLLEASPEPRGARRFIIPALVASLLICMPLGCLGYMRWWYPFWTERALNTHRSYYESLVRQIEQDELPPGRKSFYRLTGDRLAGTLTRLPPGPSSELFYSASSWRMVSASRREDGSLCVRIPVYQSISGLNGHGVMYSSSEMTPESANFEVGPEGGATQVDKHWWTIELWLGH